ncbi:sulfide/dihydroorotate dehydrogenase-like FAD/NAD-binding protein [Candidatus Woesearchaeota archaeon]|nr:sulfide/dihydroorotate dehydrogenase-like FAD/NAD-binding protein [Candidatus Woesearchaeota archaeon]
MNKIIEKKQLNATNILFRVEAPEIAKKARAGQFIILRIREKGERIPLTIADWDKDSITLVFQPVGKTTNELAELKVNDKILDLMGPLGTPSHIEKFGTVVMIGGGLGIAPCYPIAKAMKQAGNKVICIFGARNKELFFWQDKFKKVSDEIILCTDDGSLGIKGFTTDGLKQLMQKGKIDRIVAIGPTIMMKFITLTAGDIPVVVSLNPIMVDGMGMCGGCRVLIDGEVKFACVDGPEFIGQKVDWDSLLNRVKTYEEEEHKCKINLQ